MRALQSKEPLPPLTVDLHPDRPLRRGIAPPPKKIPAIALPPDPQFDELEAKGGKLDLRRDYHEIIGRDGLATGVGVSGEIPRVTPFEVGLPGAVTWMIDETNQGGWFTDEVCGRTVANCLAIPRLIDSKSRTSDTLLSMSRGRGSYYSARTSSCPHISMLIRRCSHAGICNVITDAISKYDRPIHMIVGGFHLVPVEQQPVDMTIDFIARRLQPKPRYVLPLHCTGLEPRARLKRALGDACIAAGVGMKVTVDGGNSAEAESGAEEEEGVRILA
jgi:7,8-dihydropterin-6-yl-methyl-4-(beta-D-ribofuranosyl)aminobenzene 5'-phosphate synthase